MYSKLLKKTILFTAVSVVTACSNLNGNHMSVKENQAAQEQLYESTQNYSSLISLYREKLKVAEDAETRYKLSNVYYLKGDSESSLLYLKPLLVNTSPLFEKASILEIRNLIQLKNYNQAVNSSSNLIAMYPRNAEAHNLRGIAYAQMGRLNEAQNEVNQARNLFLSDVIAINNMAMLKIINGDYKNAVQLLLPQYLNGVKEQHVLHNLVFALVKSGDTDYAIDIIKKERLSTSPKDLVNALKKTEKVSTSSSGRSYAK